MITFLLRRAFYLILTLFAVSIGIFAMSEIAPGNIAINSLGNTITPAQEASFNAQNGLDQPAVTRYIRWMIGSDWRAAGLIGYPVRQIYEADLNRWSWWGALPDGTLFQNYTDDGENMIRVERLADGSTRDVPLGPEVWKTDAEGFPVFWGVDREGRAAMWVRGDDNEAWTLGKSTWRSSKGAPRAYIPLQKGLLRGDPGVSFFTRRPVAETLVPRLMNTLLLAGIAFVVVMPLALALGMLAGLNEGRFLDRLLSISSLVATATPEFASGVFLILIFSTWLKWLPGAVVVTSDTAIFERPQMLVLPIITLTLIELGYVLRITRASMVEVMRTNYIRTATLKGLPQWRIVTKHALRNALMAPITVIILHVNWLIGGIVVVETLFGFPGLGRYVMEAALFKDVFAIEAATMVLVVIAVGTQLVADLIYTYINPRIRYT
ncbi:ABC transporter permease [Oscillochloris sp. ZM17-4]|uniref:ABC transporter permease n=1 Tax=Oscillochloris sp. ZM17-4 TaxID=2866714 RepID=UPI001C730D2B|nr:ABC transporter permease [Oscillochloris sp. ZM17-4]MBX0328898.1 ABC transporter permease [Oscillochloris sp. ZM17-4]